MRDKLITALKAVVDTELFDAEECARTRPGGPCEHCKAILDAKQAILEAEAE